MTTDTVAQRCEWVRRYRERRPVELRRHDRYARARDLVILAVSAPLWLAAIAVLALMVWFDSPGAPVFFRQERTGRHGHRFTILKFRTMIPDAEQRKHELLHLNELQWPDFKITDDPRITGIGRRLRAAGLDELPQLFSVVLGDMALVGPRPTSFGADTYELWQTERLDARPGLTGLWQTSGRGETVWDERLRIEVAYVRRRCTALDIEILVRTVAAVLRGEGR